MKKLLIASVIGLTAFGAQAHGPSHYGGHYGHHHGGGWGWVAPALIGGAVVYAATRPPVVQAAPVVVQPQPMVMQQQNCTPWVEIRNPDGSTTYSRTCQ